MKSLTTTRVTTAASTRCENYIRAPTGQYQLKLPSKPREDSTFAARRALIRRA
jgi:hypothetical protein